MYKPFLLLAFLLGITCIQLNAQMDTVLQTEEYAMIRTVVYYEGGSIVNPVFSEKHPNPTLTIGAKTTSFRNYLKNREGENFKTVPEMLDYMNKWGWSLVTSNTMEYLGEGIQDDNSLISINKYIQILIFKREIKGNG